MEKHRSNTRTLPTLLTHIILLFCLPSVSVPSIPYSTWPSELPCTHVYARSVQTVNNQSRIIHYARTKLPEQFPSSPLIMLETLMLWVRGEVVRTLVSPCNVRKGICSYTFELNPQNSNPNIIMRKVMKTF